MNPVRVLVADDDLSSRSLLQEHLVRWGYQVVPANSGQHAMEILERDHAPQLAIVDWILPGGMDGLEICRRTRERPGPYVYILLLTAKDRKEDLIAGLSGDRHCQHARGCCDRLCRALAPRSRELFHRAGSAQSGSRLSARAAERGTAGTADP